jgi:hypothetical protein
MLWNLVLGMGSDGAVGLVLASGAKARALRLHVIAKLRGYADAEQVLWIHQPATTFLKCPRRVLFQFLCRQLRF